MIDLFTYSGSLAASYQAVYDSLGELRETFHRYGRFDDSNAKLDEVAKLFATYLAFKKGQIPEFPHPEVPEAIKGLQEAFRRVADLPQYRTAEGTSIFGSNPALSLRAGDERLATELTRLVRQSIDFAFELRSDGKPFDVLNEAFGHFVRDNFRGNVEDAQYMTPPEVVEFMVDIALYELALDFKSSDANDTPLTVVDPTCGVGSFLAAVYNHARTNPLFDRTRLRLFGQDKVERMVRLATLNLELFEVETHQITMGNSLALGSPLDELNGKVDLILTNPPFGARFNGLEVCRNFGKNTPFFSRHRNMTRSIDSELLFVDRNLELLRDGGRMLIVVPDGVISARGLAAMLRQDISSRANLLAIVELPAVTFAQAGTRTKTAVLYLRKSPQPEKMTGLTFLAVSSDLGFQVNSRKGAQVKVSEGQNDLPLILTSYKSIESNASSGGGEMILSGSPSAVIVPSIELLTGHWTPSHYSATRFKSVASAKQAKGFQLRACHDLVEFLSDLRRPESYVDGWAFISVLHILGEGLLDVRAALDYAPKTPGVEVQPGELLLSRINPRIPRICIVPDLGTKILCSSEFEIMRPKAGIDVHELAFLLQCGVVQDQITSLTSGTSASHNRIRTAELAEVQIPVPEVGSHQASMLKEIASRYSSALDAVMMNVHVLAKIRGEEKNLFTS